MPRVTDEYREARRDEIADAALRCFAKRGFQATSMADIIEESGLSAGAIYGHYASKQEIVVTVAERILTARVGDLRRLSTETIVPPPSAVIGSMVQQVSAQFGGARILLQIWGEAATEPLILDLVHDVFLQVQSAFAGYLTAWAAQNPDPSREDPVEWANGIFPVFFGMGQGYLIQSALLADFDGEAYLAGVDRLVA